MSRSHYNPCFANLSRLGEVPVVLEVEFAINRGYRRSAQ